jgi:hypothetical protein
VTGPAPSKSLPSDLFSVANFEIQSNQERGMGVRTCQAALEASGARRAEFESVARSVTIPR